MSGISHHYRAAAVHPFHENNFHPEKPGTIIAAPVPASHDHEDLRPAQLHVRERTGKLPVEGQGTIAVQAEGIAELLIRVVAEGAGAAELQLLVTEQEAGFWWRPEGSSSPVPLPAVAIKGMEACCIRTGMDPETYWFSIDKKNGVLRYGQGYLNANMVLLEAKLAYLNSDGVYVWADQAHKAIELLTSVDVIPSGGSEDVKMVIQPVPVVDMLPPYVVSHEDITLQQLADGLVTVAENLPRACLQLYANIAGPKFTLEDPTDPEGFHFASAIEHSCNTKGLTCYNLLKKKASEFGRTDFFNTYLRITLGHDLGNSPGPPYVLEIWPAGHYSPIHDHGDSHAVIRVLHGQIHSTFYDSLSSRPRQQGPAADLRKGDVTWMSNESYQIHQLHNRDTDGHVCITIQCYTYGGKDHTHFEFFRYLGSSDGGAEATDVREFKPNTDMTFKDFKRAMIREWNDLQRGNVTGSKNPLD